MAKAEKTNVMRTLERLKIPFRVHCYADSGLISGADVADYLGQDAGKVFKTLVTAGKSRNHYVFMIPVKEELDLKKAAKHFGEKSVAMIPAKEITNVTGYIKGGCSPIGMKKLFPTFIDETAILFEKIFVSGGKVGLNLEIAPEDLAGFVPAEFADLA